MSRSGAGLDLQLGKRGRQFAPARSLRSLTGPPPSKGELRTIRLSCQIRYMRDRYVPPSGFLRAVIDEDVPLIGSAFATANLQRLIEMTRDKDPANRDWATLLLAQQDLDTPEVREALLRAAEDDNDAVRAEAIFGVAQRDKALALPLLQKELARKYVAMPIFEAAALVADPSLVDDLRAYAQPSGDEFLDQLALDALKACETGEPA